MLNEEFAAALRLRRTPGLPAAANELRSKRVELVVRCQELARFLRGFEETAWSDWTEERIGQIRMGDHKGVAALLDGFCGFANIADVFLCPEAGHRMRASDENTVNEQFLQMISRIHALAREVQELIEIGTGKRPFDHRRARRLP